MTERDLANYLNEVLKLDPHSEAEMIVASRTAFLDPTGIVSVNVAGGEKSDDNTRYEQRTVVRQQLLELRNVFWLIEDADLERRLAWLGRTPLPETAAIFARMREAAVHRGAMRTLIAERQIPFSFLASFGRLLIAPAAEANLWRERLFSAMRPERNLYYTQSQTIMKNAVKTIRERFPYLYAMEEAWLSEILEFNDGESTIIPADSFETLALLSVAAATLASLAGIAVLLTS